MLEQVTRWRPTTTALRRTALAGVVANTAIVVTGGAVRLTASGLGCPDWPTCSSGGLVTRPENGAHGLIELGNRLLTYVLLIVVVAVLVAVVRAGRRDLRPLAILGVLGIPAQAVLGGITVRTGLNPWTVGAHFLLSSVLIALATLLWLRVDPAPVSHVPPVLRNASRGLLGVVAAVLVVGVVVTGSGPHSGDLKTGRNGLDPAAISQLHADLVFALVGLTIGLLVAFLATGAQQAARATAVLLGVVLAQGLIGFVQYWTDLPALLVALHMLGSCLVLIAAVRVVQQAGLSPRERAARPRTARRTPVPA